MKVISIKERKDGSADMTFELGVKDEARVRELAKKQGKRYSKAFVKGIVLQALEYEVNKK